MPAASFPYLTDISNTPVTRYRTLPLSTFDQPFFNETILHQEEDLRIETQESTSAPLPLSGFVFHSAHCGSTLLSRMLSGSGAVRTINETDAINGLLLSYRMYNLVEEEVIEKLQKIVADYLILPEHRRHAVFKLSSWNTFFLPLFQKAFPEVPWIYLYREEEALVKSLLRSGYGFTQWYELPTDFMVRAFIPAEIAIDSKEAYLREMSRLQFGIAQDCQRHKGILLQYPDFLEGFSQTILPHFGIELNETETEAAMEMLHYDAKSAEKTVYQPKG